ncbi:MAG: nickel-responsive transcriptional regulator NikR [Oligoflexia bacterium]|nr:nickel-responsive transcriptional regulator NikR [Oligoflexia bacterium]MBF0364386.1 nickel-responsive transcriptional regulator NikR [Oligoflexia bacterium]
MRRFAISLSDQLADKFDQFIKKEKLANRSVAIANIMAKEIAKHSWTNDPSEEVTAAVTLVYDHHKGPIAKKLTDIQHDHHQNIICSQHIHLSHDDCLDVVVCKGTAISIKKFYDQIKSVKSLKSHSISIFG